MKVQSARKSTIRISKNESNNQNKLTREKINYCSQNKVSQLFYFFIYFIYCKREATSHFSAASYIIFVNAYHNFIVHSIDQNKLRLSYLI